MYVLAEKTLPHWTSVPIYVSHEQLTATWTDSVILIMQCRQKLFNFNFFFINIFGIKL